MNQQESSQSPSDNLVPSERAALRQVRRRRLQALFGGSGAILIGFMMSGCPEPADMGTEPGGGMNMAGSGGSGGGATGKDACELPCVDKVFAQNVLTCKICHYADMPNLTPPMPSLGKLDLVSPGVTARLKDVPAKHAEIITMNPVCPMGDKLIDTAFPGDSWMLKKIRMQQGTCGDKMPSTSPLSAMDLACLETYISCVAGGKPLTMTAGGGGSPGTAGSAGAATGGGGAGGASAGGGMGGSGGTGGGGCTGGT